MSPSSSLAIDERLSVLHEELAELTGQRNAIDARIVGIAAEIDRDELWAAAGARSTAGWVAWKAGVSRSRGETIAAIAARYDEFPTCIEGLREGRFSVDQVGVIAEHGLPGSDAHFATMAQCATVSQLRTALSMQPKPQPEPAPEPDDDGEEAATVDPGPQPSITSTSDEQYTYWQIALPHVEAAAFEAALASHRDALITEWKAADPDGRAAMPTTAAAFLRLVHMSWDAEAAARPHGQRTTVVVHVDVADKVAALHLGPVLSDRDRHYLTCDATCEVWFRRDGRVIGASRSTRTVNRRLRRALEHRDRCCVVPGCGATRALHAHHLVHWEDGGPTELWNLALVCPYHHRAHHRGLITITGPADQLVVTDAAGRALTSASLARTPTQPPPEVAPCPGPTGERANWWWYQPYEPRPPSTD
ncbi:MAG: DUF222 domain-containing protein [Mycobacterium kyogaense]|uniref:HNH endonuclease signature motif containing protein n=1 Tax=Mycobacterium kyogaense TaxID=2212479 RepID=UPI002FF5919D